MRQHLNHPWRSLVSYRWPCSILPTILAQSVVHLVQIVLPLLQILGQVIKGALAIVAQAG